MPSYQDEAPTGAVADNSYVSRPGHKNEQIPIQSDSEGVEDPIDETVADSDQQLGRDEKEAIDTSNIIEDRTRGAKPAQGTYRAPGDDEGLPTDDGTSSAGLKTAD